MTALMSAGERPQLHARMLPAVNTCAYAYATMSMHATSHTHALLLKSHIKRSCAGACNNSVHVPLADKEWPVQPSA